MKIFQMENELEKEVEIKLMHSVSRDFFITYIKKGSLNDFKIILDYIKWLQSEFNPAYLYKCCISFSSNEP